MGLLDAFLALLGISGKKVNILLVGLDNSGKSTVLERLKPKHKQSPEVPPTVGFSIERFQRGGLDFTAFDMSGAGRYRPLWEQYYREAQAVVFVIDSADACRLVVAKDELEQMLGNEQLCTRVPVLFLANKRDLPTALPPVDIAEKLNLTSIKDRPWNIMPSNALCGEGLDKGMDWLSDKILRR